MAKKTKVSIAVVRRLPRYHRYLEELLNKGVKRISSKELSEIMNITASQIRQDLNVYGGFGQQGYGYNTEELYKKLGEIIGIGRTYNMIIIGAGNMGQALANYPNFEKYGFKLIGIFDRNPKMFGLKIRDVEIMDVDKMGEFVKNNKVDIAIICVPSENAQKVANKVVEMGIKAIWNFAPTDIDVPDDVVVENVHLSDSLLSICYRMNEDELFKNLGKK